MASPFLAWCLRRAKTSSCLRRRFAPSSSLAIAMSTSSETCLSFRSDRCIGLDGPGGKGATPGGPLQRKGEWPGYGGGVRDGGGCGGGGPVVGYGVVVVD